MLRMVESGEGEQRPDRGQPHVAGADAVVPFGFEVVEERGDRGGVEIVPIQPGRQFPAALVGEDHQ